ncbi:MAG: hypothetical protein JWR16_2409 [Nevskia sp.]|nr:hypothetical protein [Nevskia sp.]
MTPITALIGFTAWTLLLVLVVFGYRGIRVLSGTPINAWPRGAALADPAFVKRVSDAHINCLENLPIFAVIVLSAAALSKLPAIALLAPYVLYARLGQSLTHLIGTSVPLVMIRATFWAIQLVLFVLMFKELLT